MHNRTLIFLSVGLVGFCASAQVEVAKIFFDHMVLQRNAPVPVWGRGDRPGEKVTVTFGGAACSATVDAKGDWSVELPPMKENAVGREMQVKGEGSCRLLRDILVGDVWLVSGQSNAEFAMQYIQDRAKEAERAKAYPNIRAAKFEHKVSPMPVTYESCNCPWLVCNEQSFRRVSAIGYIFAQEINRRTGVPIGLLDIDWGGCRIEPFIPLEGVAEVPELADVKAQIAEKRATYLAWMKNPDFSRQFPDPDLWTRQHNAMVEPIVRYPITGALWYQGCSNGGEGKEYVTKLQALIAGWRAKWKRNLPVYIVQLASFTAKTTDPAGGNGYARIRNAQRIAAQTIPNTGLAVALDVGNATDIHPTNKRDVGERLARWARRDVYGEKDLVVSGPLYRSMTVEDGRIRLAFDHVGTGLFAGEKAPDTPGVAPTATPDGRLRGFAIAGADKKWHWADAVIDGKDVVVSAKEVPSPVAVRYAHRANPMGDCNLYNKDGLPASPFRTDNW